MSYNGADPTSNLAIMLQHIYIEFGNSERTYRDKCLLPDHPRPTTQPQRVANDENARQAHRSGGQDG